jgi:hypothetical protein
MSPVLTRMFSRTRDRVMAVAMLVITALVMGFAPQAMAAQYTVGRRCWCDGVLGYFHKLVALAHVPCDERYADLQWWINYIANSVPTQSIGRLVVSNNSSVTLIAGTTGNTLDHGQLRAGASGRVRIGSQGLHRGCSDADRGHRFDRQCRRIDHILQWSAPR